MWIAYNYERYVCGHRPGEASGREWNLMDGRNITCDTRLKAHYCEFCTNLKFRSWWAMQTRWRRNMTAERTRIILPLQTCGVRRSRRRWRYKQLSFRTMVLISFRLWPLCFHSFVECNFFIKFIYFFTEIDRIRAVWDAKREESTWIFIFVHIWS